MVVEAFLDAAIYVLSLFEESSAKPFFLLKGVFHVLIILSYILFARLIPTGAIDLMRDAHLRMYFSKDFARRTGKLQIAGI